jgi:two-component system, chemotaxis family, chemotaxis protein CheY
MPNIIIVDDTVDLLRVYARFFEMAGFKVLATFFDGTEVVEYVQSLKNDPLKLDETKKAVIIIDYRMPRMNGVEAAKSIRELQNGNATIVLNTADDISQLHYPEGLFDGILHKPFSIADFLELMARLSREGKTPLFREGCLREERSIENR